MVGVMDVQGPEKFVGQNEAVISLWLAVESTSVAPE